VSHSYKRVYFLKEFASTRKESSSHFSYSFRRTNNVHHLCQVLKRSIKESARRHCISTMCTYIKYFVCKSGTECRCEARAYCVSEEKKQMQNASTRCRPAYACFFFALPAVYIALSFVRERNAKLLHRLTVVGLLRRERSVSGGRAAHVQSRTLCVPAGAQVHQTLRGLQN
jgi:hypothetical protein